MDVTPYRAGTARRRVALVAFQVAVALSALIGPMPALAVQTHTVTITPTTAVAGVATSFTLTVNNVSTAPGQTQLGCVRIAVPAGLTLSGTPTVLAQDPPIPPGTSRTWSSPTVVTGALQTIRTGVAANDIDASGRVQVTFTGTAAAAGTLTFTTSAFGQTNCSGQVFALSGASPTVTVSSLNSAPVLDPAGSPSLAEILEDPVGDDGDSIPAIVTSGGAGYITDADAGAAFGLAVVGADTSFGAWQYSTDGGSNWAGVGAVSTANARLLASAASNRLRFVPNADANGGATVTVRAWDTTTGTNGGTADTTTNGGTSAFSIATDSVSITVTPVNDAPSFTAGSDQTVAEDSGPQNVAGWATALSVGPADESAQAVAFSITGNTNAPLFAAGPAVDASGTLSYTPAADANGAATIDLSLADDGGTANGGSDSSATETFTITVTAVNDAPVCVDDAGSTAEDTPLVSSVSCTDVDGDSLTYAAVALPADGGLAFAPDGSFTYSPDLDFNGTDAFTFIANDGDKTSTAATFTIAVGPGNDPPVLDPIGPQSGTEGTEVTFVATATDLDVPPNTLTFSLSGAPVGATVDPDSGAFGWTPPNDGVVTFDVCVSDGTASDCETVTVTVANVAPTVTLTGPASATAGQTLTFTYVVADPGDDTQTVTEDCGSSAISHDTPAPSSFDCTFPSGPASSTVSVTSDDGAESGSSGSDAILVTIAAAGGGSQSPSASPTPSPSASPSPSQGAGSPSPAPPGEGSLPDTALPTTPVTLVGLLAAFVAATCSVLVIGGMEPDAPPRRRSRRRTGRTG